MTPLGLLAQIEVPPAPPLPPVGQAPVPPPDIPPEVLAWLQSVPPQLVLIVILTVLAIGGSLLFLLVRGIARRLEGGANIKELRAEVEAMRQRLAEMDDGGGRIADLEERLDFNERILAQVQRERIPGPHP
ncbi:MAG TPA: hypothetical protein VMK53_07990 [Gemmatimonadales bacterium]|nr:hypothetical protein [Gemmatimonadales bacterium]